MELCIVQTVNTPAGAYYDVYTEVIFRPDTNFCAVVGVNQNAITVCLIQRPCHSNRRTMGNFSRHVVTLIYRWYSTQRTERHKFPDVLNRDASGRLRLVYDDYCVRDPRARPTCVQIPADSGPVMAVYAQCIVPNSCGDSFPSSRVYPESDACRKIIAIRVPDGKWSHVCRAWFQWLNGGEFRGPRNKRQCVKLVMPWSLKLKLDLKLDPQSLTKLYVYCLG